MNSSFTTTDVNWQHSAENESEKLHRSELSQQTIPKCILECMVLLISLMFILNLLNVTFQNLDCVIICTIAIILFVVGYSWLSSGFIWWKILMFGANHSSTENFANEFNQVDIISRRIKPILGDQKSNLLMWQPLYSFYVRVNCLHWAESRQNRWMINASFALIITCHQVRTLCFHTFFVANLNYRLHSNETADFQREIKYYSRKYSFSVLGFRWITSLATSNQHYRLQSKINLILLVFHKYFSKL